MKIVLASQSPRRRELLGQMGLKFTICKPDLDESAFGGLPARDLVRTLSAEKAGEVAGRCAPDDLIIAADTVVVLDGAILGKPRDRDEAGKMLAALSGREHLVCTGVTVRRGGETVTEHEETRVVFRPLTAEEIRRYVATGEPMDKAGAYGIQGYGALLVEGIQGDYFNVMGLPVCRLGKLLARFGVDCLERAAPGA